MAADELCGLRRWRCSSALVVSGREQRLWGWALSALCVLHTPFFAGSRADETVKVVPAEEAAYVTQKNHECLKK
jgi:hypothetical protein